jgi:hypothetical protein
MWVDLEKQTSYLCQLCQGDDAMRVVIVLENGTKYRTSNKVAMPIIA